MKDRKKDLASAKKRERASVWEIVEAMWRKYEERHEKANLLRFFVVVAYMKTSHTFYNLFITSTRSPLRRDKKVYIVISISRLCVVSHEKWDLYRKYIVAKKSLTITNWIN